MRIHQARGVDEVLLMDITATKENRGPDLDMIEHIADGCFFPLTVGGGVRTLEDARELIRRGADKVAVCTGALMADRDLVCDIAGALGSQAVSVVVDVRAGEVWAHATDQYMGDPVEYCYELQNRGAGEIILQSADRDGTLCGYDLPTVDRVRESIEVPLVVSGGCGTYEHMHEALQAGADAVAAGAMFQFTDQTPKGAARYLAERGWEVRYEAA